MNDTITLAPSRLTPGRFFRVIAGVRLRRVWWALALMIAAGAYLLFQQDGSPFRLIMLCFAFGYPLLVYGWLFVWCHLPRNRVIYEEREAEMNAERLLVRTSGGIRSEVPWSYVRRMQETAGFFLLHIGAGRMILLPKTSFREPEDVTTFKGWLAARKSL